MKYPIPPGVFDIIPFDNKEIWKSSYLWAYLEEVIRSVCRDYGYLEIRTPLFERTELFQEASETLQTLSPKKCILLKIRGALPFP